MRQPSYRRDLGVTLRMAFTSLMLLLIFMAFGLLLLVAGMPWIFLAAIGVVMVAFQYFASDHMLVLKLKDSKHGYLEGCTYAIKDN